METGTGAGWQKVFGAFLMPRPQAHPAQKKTLFLLFPHITLQKFVLSFAPLKPKLQELS